MHRGSSKHEHEGRTAGHGHGSRRRRARFGLQVLAFAVELVLLATGLAGAVGAPVIAGVSAAARPTAPPAPPCRTRLATLIARAAPGTVVVVPACLAREKIVIDKRITLRGLPGAQIRGSDVWTDWTASGSRWRSARSVPQFDTHGACAGGDTCTRAEQVFRDGMPLRLVGDSPQHGEFALDDSRRVVLGDTPVGHLVEVTVRDAWVVIAARGVVVTGFAMAQAANDAQSGAIRNVPGAGRDTVSGNVISYAHGAGVALDFGNDNIISGNDIGYNGQLGVHLGGSDGQTDGLRNVVRGNRIHDNNLAGFSPEWEAGGLKATVQEGLTIDGNEVWANAGPGLWCDIYCSDVRIDGNRVHDNTHAGIMYEVSSGGTIADNVVWRNGSGKNVWGWGAGILVSSSGSTAVTGNVVAWNASSGISVISQHRTDWPDVQPTGISVEDNTMVASSGGWFVFWAQDWNGPLFDPASGNVGSGNRYGTVDGVQGRGFRWQGDYDSVSAFNATPGEEGGTVLTEAETTSALEAAQIPTAQ